MRTNILLAFFDNQCEKIHNSFQQRPLVGMMGGQTVTRPFTYCEHEVQRQLKTNLGSHTLPNNQFSRTFGSHAFQFPLVSPSGLGPVGPV